MKKLIRNILITIYAILIASCDNSKIDYTAEKSVINVLNKRTYNDVGISEGRHYELYLYNGNDAQWYNTDKGTYLQYEKGDTLPTLVLKITITKTQ